MFNAILQESITAHIRQHILYIGNHKGQADEFVHELTFAKRLYEHFLRDNNTRNLKWRFRRLDCSEKLSDSMERET